MNKTRLDALDDGFADIELDGDMPAGGIAALGSAAGPGDGAGLAVIGNRDTRASGREAAVTCSRLAVAFLALGSLAASVDAQVSGSGITFTTALSKAHAAGAQVGGSGPTPGAANQFARRSPN